MARHRVVASRAREGEVGGGTLDHGGANLTAPRRGGFPQRRPARSLRSLRSLCAWMLVAQAAQAVVHAEGGPLLSAGGCRIGQGGQQPGPLDGAQGDLGALDAQGAAMGHAVQRPGHGVDERRLGEVQRRQPARLQLAQGAPPGALQVGIGRGVPGVVGWPSGEWWRPRGWPPLPLPGPAGVP